MLGLHYGMTEQALARAIADEMVAQGIGLGGGEGGSSLSQAEVQAAIEAALNTSKRGTFTSRSGTLSAGGTAQSVCSANTSRNYFFFQNVSDADLWVRFGGTATQSQPAIRVPPLGSLELIQFVSTESVSVIGATTGQAYTALEA